MKKSVLLLAALAPMLLFAQAPRSITWDANNYPAISQVLGTPSIISTRLGYAAHFNGATDGMFTNEIPVKGMEEVTLEVIMNQHSGANVENRYLHMGEVSGPRIMFETRVTPENTWYADFFVVMSDTEKAIVIDEHKTHPCDKWYNVTLVADKNGIKGYVNGELQGATPINFRAAISTGATSVGVRQNLQSWFNGDIYKIRITGAALTPDQFLKDHEELNK